MKDRFNFDGFPQFKEQLAPIPSSFCNGRTQPSQIVGGSLYLSGCIDQLHQILIRHRARSPKHTAKPVELGSEVIRIGGREAVIGSLLASKCIVTSQS